MGSKSFSPSDPSQSSIKKKMKNPFSVEENMERLTFIVHLDGGIEVGGIHKWMDGWILGMLESE